MKKSKGVAIIAIILACLIGLGYYTSTIMTATSTSQKKTDLLWDGIQTRMLYLFSEGVKKRGLSMKRFVEAHQPAAR